MKNFIPYEKLSKKEKRKVDRTRRQTWGGLSPVTRKPECSRAYNRRKSQDWKGEIHPLSCDFFLTFPSFPHNLTRIWGRHRVALQIHSFTHRLR